MSTESNMDLSIWPVPCPSDGNVEACEKCWASHSDATPYCTTEYYKKLKIIYEKEHYKGCGCKDSVEGE